jgi:glycosyltransferase involved in cell wall biosynthesis
MQGSSSISVVLPAFNEAQNLATTVNDGIETLQKIGADHEILIVDDGSTDDTPAICRELAARYSAARIIRHERNRGYGAALRTGFSAARHDFIFFTDADGQFRFDQLSEFFASIDGADAVIGYRARRQDSWHRKFNAHVGNWIACPLLGLRARDINCAYKLLRRQSLRQLPLRCDGAMINTELLAFAARADWKIRELPVSHYPRRFGRASGANLGVVGRTIVEFFQARRRLVRPAPSESLVSLEATES